MWVIKAIDKETNVCLEESYAYREVEIEGLKYSYGVTKPYARVEVSIYTPWTKEIAEEEIKKKAKALGIKNPLPRKRIKKWLN